MDKNLPAMQELQETQVQSLGQQDPLEKGMATHSSVLAWRISWTGEPGGLQSMGTEATLHTHTRKAIGHSKEVIILSVKTRRLLRVTCPAQSPLWPPSVMSLPRAGYIPTPRIPRSLIPLEHLFRVHNLIFWVRFRCGWGFLGLFPLSLSKIWQTKKNYLLCTHQIYVSL